MGMHSRQKSLGRSVSGNIAILFLLTVMALLMLIPIVYAVSNALKPFDELFVFPPRLLVRNPTGENFIDLFNLMADSWVPFSRYFFNTIFITAVGTAGHVLIASMAAYALAKFDFRGRNLLFGMVVLALMFSPAVTAVPSYIIMARLGWVDSLAALIIPAFQSSLGLYLMKQFMEQLLPDSLIEAARIDGKSEAGIFFTIAFPLAKPAWLTLTIFTFQAAWNSTGQTFIFNEELKLLPIAVSQVVASNSIARMGVGMASTVFLMVPPIVLFILSQSWVIQTMAHAGIKE